MKIKPDENRYSKYRLLKECWKRRMLMIDRMLIGVDIGGTKISAGRVSGRMLLKQNYFKNPAKESADIIASKIIEAIEDVFSENVAGIGIGVPGLVDTKKGIVWDVQNIPSLNHYPLKATLENHFRVPVYLNNDANCYAVGEKYFGMGNGYDNIVALTLGTGLGVGLVINGHIYEGKNGGAGEFCNVKYRDSNLEEYCSSFFFRKKYDTDSLTLSRAARQGDKTALKIFSEFGRHVGEAIHFILAVLDPQIVILGGSIANAYPFFGIRPVKCILL